MKNKSTFFLDMQFITSSISTTLVLLLLGMLLFFVLSAVNLSTYVRENITISLLLSDDMKANDLTKFRQKLNEAEYVKELTYISKEQALKEQTEAMGTDPAEFLGYNPFTASIEIKLKADYAEVDSIRWIQKQIQEEKSVLDVVYPEDLLDAVNRNIKKISIFLLGLATLLTLISFALINNTIRLSIYSKRFLIHTMKLVGASWSFIRKPFLMRNLWIGIVAALAANGILVGLGLTLLKYEPELAQLITPITLGIVMGGVFLFGILITLLCAYISINKYLRMKANALYYI